MAISLGMYPIFSQTHIYVYMMVLTTEEEEIHAELVAEEALRLWPFDWAKLFDQWEFQDPLIWPCFVGMFPEI